MSGNWSYERRLIFREDLLKSPPEEERYGIMSESELVKAKPSHNERRNATTSFACGIMRESIM